MTTDKRQFTLRTDEVTLEKMAVIAKKNKRSIAMQIEFVLEKHIDEFEKENGPIKLGPKSF